MREIINFKKYLLFILMFILASCFPTLKMRKSFSDKGQCYTGKDTQLNLKINTNGVYTDNNSLYIFYNDGTFIYYWNDLNTLNNEMKFTKNDFYNKYYGGKNFGHYIFCTDTIKVLFIDSYGSLPTIGGEIWFKIKDKNTIEEIYYHYGWEKANEEFILKYEKNIKKNRRSSPFEFRTFENLPDSDKIWIKSRSWYWQNKDEYKKWKRNQKTIS